MWINPDLKVSQAYNPLSILLTRGKEQSTSVVKRQNYGFLKILDPERSNLPEEIITRQAEMQTSSPVRK